MLFRSVPSTPTRESGSSEADAPFKNRGPLPTNPGSNLAKMKSPHSGRSPRAIRACQIGFLALLGFGAEANAQAPGTSANRFEKNVQAYEAADKATHPPQGAILLVGDSQFFRWKTVSEDLAGYTVINRGIDSFQFSDLLHFTDRLVLTYQPRLIILHVGGNDVHHGKTAEHLLSDFKTFVQKVRTVLPQVPIAFTSITPSPGRWSEAEVRQQANRAIRDYIATQKNLHFIDLWDAMLTSGGKPREDIWVEDRVHPNHAGYLIRVKIMQPLLGAPDKTAP